MLFHLLDISVKVTGLFSSVFLKLFFKGEYRFLNTLDYYVYTICGQFCISLSLNYP